MSKVLIIDDNEAIRESYVYGFESAGFEVLSAKNGKEGLKIAFKERPDIILLDIVMPKMDGLSMLKELRSDVVWGKNVPVIMLTNVDGDNDIVKEIIETGPIYYLVKSDITIEETIEKVNEYLNK